MDNHQRFQNQSETAEDEKNGFLKMFLNLSEFCGQNLQLTNYVSICFQLLLLIIS